MEKYSYLSDAEKVACNADEGNALGNLLFKVIQPILFVNYMIAFLKIYSNFYSYVQLIIKICVKKGGLYMFVYDILEKKKLDLKILILNYRKEKKQT